MVLCMRMWRPHRAGRVMADDVNASARADHRKRLFLRLFIAAAVVEIAFGALRRGSDAREFLDGARDFEAVSGVVALSWLPVMGAMLALAVHQLGWFRRRRHEDRQALDALAAGSSEWVWEANDDLVVTATNERVQDVLGRSPRDVVGRSLFDLLAPHERSRVQAVARSGLAATGWRDLEAEWRRGDGTDVVLQGSGTCIRDARGGLVALRGSNRPVPLTRTALRARAAVRWDVEEILARRRVAIALQPIVELRTGRVVSAEALARFAERTPDEMFRRAESVGLGRALELLALQAALPLVADLPHGVALAVNASPSLLHDAELPRLLTEQPQLDRIVLEITERTQIDCYVRLHDVLAPLRARGMRLAVDDTGAGYSSLSHVLQLRPDIVKLDRSLISALNTDPAQRSLVTAVALFAREIGATLTAEGIETPEQVAVLTELGVAKGQGFFLGRPTEVHTEFPSLVELGRSTDRRRGMDLPAAS
ncbi:EAL domain-containing protein [Blastococcus sp. KM273128]|uniref:sensor domain-containing phosphodiesterase n=1 Tax=Blastococcus sp. KM273128 TaxID=2570314 RepID=UPI001F19E822|nr:EAL domain-containing protein [Blastococcus sp. KM273128]MCF6746002.1 EAL domain-containing protein [Blastococcus sp. KM273128]